MLYLYTYTYIYIYMQHMIDHANSPGVFDVPKNLNALPLGDGPMDPKKRCRMWPYILLGFKRIPMENHL